MISAGYKKRKNINMSDQERKFKGTRKRIRRNLEKKKAKVKRKIFLDDDDIPSTSRGTAHQHKNTTKHKRSAGFYRMSTDDKNFKSGGSKSAEPEAKIHDYQSQIPPENNVHDFQSPDSPKVDDKTLYPPKELEYKKENCQQNVNIQTEDHQSIDSPKSTASNASSDLPVPRTPGRGWLSPLPSFYNKSPVTPTSSPTELEYKNENFQQNVNTQTEDHQSIESPKSTASNASSDLLVPRTPGRDWLSPLPSFYNKSPVTSPTIGLRRSPQHHSLSLSPSSSPSSSLPSPFVYRSSQEIGNTLPASSRTPPLPTSPKQVSISQVPVRLREIINDVVSSQQNHKQLRLMKEVEGQHYRILISRSGNVRIIWLRPD